MFKYYDIFRGRVSSLLGALVLIFILAEIFVIGGRYVIGTLNDLDVLIISLSLLAVFMTFFSFIAQVGEKNMIEVRFERALKLRQFTEDEKPFLLALIKMRSRNPEIDL